MKFILSASLFLSIFFFPEYGYSFKQSDPFTIVFQTEVPIGNVDVALFTADWAHLYIGYRVAMTRNDEYRGPLLYTFLFGRRQVYYYINDGLPHRYSLVYDGLGNYIMIVDDNILSVYQPNCFGKVEDVDFEIEDSRISALIGTDIQIFNSALSQQQISSLQFNPVVNVNQFKNRGQVEHIVQKEDFSILTKDEDLKLSQNSDYMEAVSAFERKDYEVAINRLYEEIKKYPDHAQAYFLLGNIYENMELTEKNCSNAINNYKKYAELKPNGKRKDYVKLRLSLYYRVGLTQQKAGLW